MQRYLPPPRNTKLCRPDQRYHPTVPCPVSKQAVKESMSLDGWHQTRIENGWFNQQTSSHLILPVSDDGLVRKWGGRIRMPSNSHPVHPHTPSICSGPVSRGITQPTRIRERRRRTWVGVGRGRVYRASVSYQPAITRSQRLPPLRDERLPAVEQCFQASISVARPFSKTPRAGGRRKVDIGPLPNPRDGGLRTGGHAQSINSSQGKQKRSSFFPLSSLLPQASC